MIHDHVVITGYSLCTGLGCDAESSWQSLIAGVNPVKRFSLFDTTGLSCNFGVELPIAANDLFAASIKPRSRSQMTRATMIAVITAEQAATHAGLDKSDIDPSRIGVVVGATGTGYTWNDPDKDPHRILRNMANASASWIGLRHKILGPSLTVSTACASGAYALASAYDMIAMGECDIVIAGAADSSINYADVEGFESILALAEEKDDMRLASRPFSKSRSGFVMGEGGGMLIVESAASAKKRGARVYARLHRPGLTSEAYNILSPQPGGAGMARAMRRALGNANLQPQQIGYVNAHGTSTPYNDLYETQAIKEVFGSAAYRIPVSSTKPQTGHCLAGAAGVEAVLCVKALCEGVVPQTLNLNESDPECDLDYVKEGPRKLRLDHVLSNSFAFGGHNGVCIFSRGD